MDINLAISFAFSFFLGLLIGAERERVQQTKHFQDFGGIRTFIFISLLGFTSAYVNTIVGSWFMGLSFSLLFLLIIGGYAYNAIMKGHEGITTELSAILTFIVGFLCHHHTVFAVTLGILITLLLTLKDFSHHLLRHVKDIEFYATIKFAVIAFIILPFLPDRTIDPWNIFNPNKVWLFIVFVSGISFLGYVLTRLIGLEKGSRYTGLFGGITSSTAVTVAFSDESKLIKKDISNTVPLVSALLISMAVSFARIMFFIFLINPLLFEKILTPTLVIVALLLISSFGLRFILPHKHYAVSKFALESPFKLKTALNFGFFLVLILFAAEGARYYLGDTGIYLTSLLSGMVKGEAIAIALSSMTFNGEITYAVAVKALLISFVAGLITKYFLTRLSGSKKFSSSFGMSLILPIIAITLFLFLYG